MSNTISFGRFLGMSLMFWLVITLIFLITYIFLNWLFYYKIFRKMGYKGWECFIPYYNTYCFYKGIHNPIWLFIISLCVSLIGIIYNINQIPIELSTVLVIISCSIHFITVLNLSKSFKIDVFLIILLVFLPFIGLPIIGFGSSQYLYEKRK